MKKIFFIFLSLHLLFTQLVLAQNTEPKFHGYIQSRFISNFDNSNDFMIRRAKLWVDGNAPGLENVTYKIQTIYRSFKDEAVMLQDAFADVKLNGFGSFRAGRFVPDFMLQRMQPDYEIPVLERASVINGLIHSSKSMARQIGVQLTYQPNYFPIHFSFSVFNANLDSPGKNNDGNLLYTSHTQLEVVKNEEINFKIGFSATYRYANLISMNTIYDASKLISGNDFRFGFEYQLIYKNWGFQSEYVQANINNDKVWGYYFLTNYSFSNNIDTIIGVEKYSDIIQTTNNNEWFSLGLIYNIAKKTKLMADIKTQVSSIKNNYLGEIQYQIYFN